MKKIGKYFSALSNEANLKGVKNAWLVFGVKDNDKSIGGSRFRTSPADLHSLKAEIANHTTGRLTFIDIYEVSTTDGRVVMLEIPAAPKEHSNCLERSLLRKRRRRTECS